MDTLIMIISILLITIVLLQSGKAEGASQMFGGGAGDLFSKRKERGSELFITRLTVLFGASFFVICVIMSL